MRHKQIWKRYFGFCDVAWLVTALILGTALGAYAGSVPHTFSNEPAITGTQLDENFNAIVNAIDALPDGQSGVQGPMGPQGPQGLAGPQGQQGIQGLQGPTGSQGTVGLTGPAGPIGPVGIAGPEGSQGPKGEGEMGPQGLEGPQGLVGPVGPQGERGDTGEVGPRGLQGERGPTGPIGPIGPAGSPDSPDRIREKYFSGASCINPLNPDDILVRVGSLCVDKFEASVFTLPTGKGTQYGVMKDDYPSSFPDNGNWTTPLFAVSVPNAVPSRHVTWFQAQQGCALSGKRLLSNAEWQMAASGTPDMGKDDGVADCAISSTLAQTGSRTTCKSNFGVHDMVGNLSEWVGDWFQSNAKADGGSVSTADYGRDGIYSIDEAAPKEERFPAALVRGGHFTSGVVAGVFSMTASVGPSYAHEKFGFRCAR